MKGLSLYIVTFLVVPLIISSADAQVEEVDEWDVPVTIIGDSARIVSRDSKLVVTGKIINEATGQPVSGAFVNVDFLKHYDYSDENGNYVLELPPGNYKVKVRQLGMQPVFVRMKVFSNGVLNVSMREGVVQLLEILVTSRPIDSNVKQSVPGVTRMNVQEIKSLPTFMGEIDVVKTLQLMPGVTSVGEGSSGINVRGGRADQNLVLFNDVPIFNSAHALGFVSAFNQDVIENFSLYKGNVPANLGGRASSVIEINTRRGNFEDWVYQGGTGPLSSRFSAEGPIAKGKTSMLVAGRLSHANWLLKKADNPDVSKSNVSFDDAYAGMTHRFSQNSSVDLTLYSSHDQFTFSDRFGYDWNNSVLSARWQSMADRKASPTLSASYGRFKNTLFKPAGVDASEITNTMNYFQLKESVHYIPADDHEVTAGLSAMLYAPGDEQRSGYASNQFILPRKAGKSTGLEWSAFVNDEAEINENISVSAGLRYSHYYHLGSDTTYHYAEGVARAVSSVTDTTFYSGAKIISQFAGLEPRLSVRIGLRENQSVKISYNRMRQHIHLISNTTAATPIDLWQVSTEYAPPQIADNYSVGYFRNFKDNLWETSGELFFKQMRNLVEYKDFPELFLNDHLETELLTGQGRAWGGELYIRRLKGKLTGWLSYTYSRTYVMVSSAIADESINGGDWFPGNYDKPHHINIILNRYLRRQGAFSAIFSYSTGRPFTAIESSYISDGTVIPIYSDRNKYRIPDYMRLDISITIGNVLKKYDDSLIFSLYNLFGRNNAYALVYQRRTSNFFIPKPYKLSVLGAAFPSLTYNIKFR